MKLLDVGKRFNKSLIYNEYVNVTDDWVDYEKITRIKMLNGIIKEYNDNPNKIVEYCNEEELKLLEKLVNNKVKKYEFDDLYRSLHSKLFLYPSGDCYVIPEELESAMKVALKKIDYKIIRKRDTINKRFIGLMKLYGILMVDMLVDMYNRYYDDFSSDNECKSYIFNSFYLKHYIFIDEPFCYYLDYYVYEKYCFDNSYKDLEYKYFTKEEVESIVNSKYKVDDKYVNKIAEIFKQNNIPISYVSFFIDYAKEVMDKGDPLELIEERARLYLKIHSRDNDYLKIKEVTENIVFILIDVPCVIYKGHSIREMMNKTMKDELTKKTKEHGKKISKNKMVMKYKEIRKESIEALKLYGNYIDEHPEIMNRYVNLFKINKMVFDNESFACHIVTFIAIDDEEPYFYKFFKENITINNKYYEILNYIKDYNYSSLFLVNKINPDNGTILLKDTKTDEEIEIIDVSLSANKILENHYIYTSLFHAYGIYFTSGYMIPFVSEDYDDIIKKINIEKKRIRGCKNELMKEILAAYKLYCKDDKIYYSSIDVE